MFLTFFFFLIQSSALVCLYAPQEMGQKKAQVEYEHSMLVRHHESTQDLEYKHLAALQKMKDEQLKRQHETEKENQHDYSSRAKQEMRKKHSLEVKQQPRCLKVSRGHGGRGEGGGEVGEGRCCL